MAPQYKRQSRIAGKNRKSGRARRILSTGAYVITGFLSLVLLVLILVIALNMPEVNGQDKPGLPLIKFPSIPASQDSDDEPPGEDSAGQDSVPAPAGDEDVISSGPKTFVSSFGDGYYYCGRTDDSFFMPAFDMSDLNGWAEASTAIGFGNSGGSRLDGTYDYDIEIVHEIQTGSSSAERGSDELHSWTYFKKEFLLSQDIIDAIEDMDIYGEHRVDDALIIYINGAEVYRYNVGPQYNSENVVIGKAIDWSSYQGYNSDPTTRPFTINTDYNNRLTGYPSKTLIDATFASTGLESGVQRILRDAASRTNFNTAVRNGTNVLTAVVGQNNSERDSDLWFDLELVIAKKPEPREYIIINPYRDVNWNQHNQYKAALHVHSTNSVDSDAGDSAARDMVLDHYNKGYDILALTDHNYLTESWLTMKNPLSKDEDSAIRNGSYSGYFPGAGANASWAVGATRKNGMISIPNTNEQSYMEHINTYFTGINNSPGDTVESILQEVEKINGISHINHPGRYTGSYSMDLVEGMEVSHERANIDKYTSLFTRFGSCLGMEIFSRLDYTSLSDRIVWDNILMETMPQRPVWGFATDDAHSKDAAGYNFTMMLMPELSEAAVKKSMETGAFYTVARVDRREEVNIYNEKQGGGYLDAIGDASTLYMLGQTTPRITDITVSGSSISITGKDYDVIEWISDGVKIHTGSSIDLNDHQERIGSYVRAHLKSKTGIACTQPFGIING